MSVTNLCFSWYDNDKKILSLQFSFNLVAVSSAFSFIFRTPRTDRVIFTIKCNQGILSHEQLKKHNWKQKVFFPYRGVLCPSKIIWKSQVHASVQLQFDDYNVHLLIEFINNPLNSTAFPFQNFLMVGSTPAWLNKGSNVIPVWFYSVQLHTG